MTGRLRSGSGQTPPVQPQWRLYEGDEVLDEVSPPKSLHKVTPPITPSPSTTLHPLPLARQHTEGEGRPQAGTSPLPPVYPCASASRTLTGSCPLAHAICPNENGTSLRHSATVCAHLNDGHGVGLCCREPGCLPLHAFLLHLRELPRHCLHLP